MQCPKRGEKVRYNAVRVCVRLPAVVDVLLISKALAQLLYIYPLTTHQISLVDHVMHLQTLLRILERPATCSGGVCSGRTLHQSPQ